MSFGTCQTMSHISPSSVCLAGETRKLQNRDHHRRTPSQAPSLRLLIFVSSLTTASLSPPPFSSNLPPRLATPISLQEQALALFQTTAATTTTTTAQLPNRGHPPSTSDLHTTAAAHKPSVAVPHPLLFNAMQALTLDVLLVLPVLFQKIFSPGRYGLAFKVMVWSHNAVFVFSILCFVYSVLSCLFGRTPYLPFVVNDAARQI
ncbi:hypothetical protein RYX36_032859 [Vicia faba]